MNGEEFFGPDDWTYLGKQNTPGSSEGTSPPVLSGSNVLQSGEMTLLASLWDSNSEIMAIFKSGNEFLTGYLLKSGEVTFDYDSPFLRLGKSSRDISHITIYGRGTGGGLTPVPLPAAGWMLIAGLGGLAAMRRRQT